MADLHRFYQLVDEFLAEQGFEANPNTGHRDGHWLRHIIAQERKKACTADTPCGQAVVKGVLRHLRYVDRWTHQRALAVVEASGFHKSLVPRK